MLDLRKVDMVRLQGMPVKLDGRGNPESCPRCA
jgi:hypothetical protein